ncbi:MAG: mevalonate kinase [Anaerolineales bacterium]
MDSETLLRYDPTQSLGLVPAAAMGTACAKAILLGEHAVVYGHPAIAVPFSGVRATAVVRPGTPGSGIVVVAQDLDAARFDRAHDDEGGRGLLLAARNAAAAVLRAAQEPDVEITLQSAIPLARGMGSSAAVSAAITRAVVAFLGGHLALEEVSRLVYAADAHYHGTPSGVDNTVVSFERPVWFERGRAPVFLSVGATLHLVMADTGAPSRTRDTVGHVRAERERDPARSDALLGEIGALVRLAREQLASGDVHGLGESMSANHALLGALGVSTPALDTLVVAAREAGALGAKLAGGGGGGCIVALTEREAADGVCRALERAGAVACYETELERDGHE